MTLYLSAEQHQLICTHAEGTYPDECCGLLLGTQTNTDGMNAKVVVEVQQTPNAWSATVEDDIAILVPDHALTDPTGRALSKTRRYWIDPKDMLQGQRYARDRRLTILGIYHSHPDHPALPSECDRALAWSGYSYLIVSVPQGNAQNLLSWTLDEHHQFQPEPLLPPQSLQSS